VGCLWPYLPGLDSASIFKNNGDGTFQNQVFYKTGFNPVSVFCADLDGDSDLDLVTANQLSDNVSILKNNGDGTFQTAVNYDAGDGPTSVFCVDLDRDTDVDIVVANYLSDSVSVLRNLSIFLRGDVNADGAINLADPIYLANSLLKGGPAPIPLLSGDVTCDGEINLADVICLANHLIKGHCDFFPCNP
jgi:hypothetical protein